MPEDEAHENFDLFIGDLLHALETKAPLKDSIRMMLQIHEPGLEEFGPYDGADKWWIFLCMSSAVMFYIYVLTSVSQYPPQRRNPLLSWRPPPSPVLPLPRHPPMLNPIPRPSLPLHQSPHLRLLPLARTPLPSPRDHNLGRSVRLVRAATTRQRRRLPRSRVLARRPRTRIRLRQPRHLPRPQGLARRWRTLSLRQRPLGLLAPLRRARRLQRRRRRRPQRRQPRWWRPRRHASRVRGMTRSGTSRA